MESIPLWRFNGIIPLDTIPAKGKPNMQNPLQSAVDNLRENASAIHETAIAMLAEFQGLEFGTRGWRMSTFAPFVESLEETPEEQWVEQLGPGIRNLAQYWEKHPDCPLPGICSLNTWRTILRPIWKLDSARKNYVGDKQHCYLPANVAKYLVGIGEFSETYVAHVREAIEAGLRPNAILESLREHFAPSKDNPEYWENEAIARRESEKNAIKRALAMRVSAIRCDIMANLYHAGNILLSISAIGSRPETPESVRERFATLQDAHAVMFEKVPGDTVGIGAVTPNEKGMREYRTNTASFLTDVRTLLAEAKQPQPQQKQTKQKQTKQTAAAA
jgi:hypothetical protein